MTDKYYMLKQDVEELHMMEESTRGTFKVPAAATNSTFVCKHGQLTVMYDAGDIPVDVTGSEDPSAILPTLKQVVASLTYNPQTTDGITFAKRGMNAVGGSPDPKTSMSLCFKTKFGSNQHYYKLKHCLLGSPGGGAPTSISFTGQGPWTISTPIYGKLEAWDATAPTNWTFITAPSTDPLMSADAGADMLTITDNDTPTNYTPVCLGASVSVFRNLAVITGGGSNLWLDAFPSGRRTQAQYILSLDDTVKTSIHDMVHNQKNTNSILTIKSATHAATLTGGKLARTGIGFDAIDEVQQVVSHIAKTFALT